MLNNWESDKERHEKMLVFDVMIAAFNALAEKEAAHISVKSIKEFIDEWFENHKKRSCGCDD